MPARWNALVPRVLAVATAVLVPAAAYVLYRFPPGEGGFYPRCALHGLTGLHCPGCGATRCLHALLHGDVGQAAAYNVLFLCFLPFLAAGGVRIWWALLTGRPLPAWRLPGWVVWAVLVVVVVFGVVRNLPFAPFTFLAPHELSGG